MNEVDQIRAQELLSSVFGAEYARSATNVEVVAVFLAAHRQQAEDAMKERAAMLALSMRGWNEIKIATAIRGIDAGGEGEGE